VWRDGFMVALDGGRHAQGIGAGGRHGELAVDDYRHEEAEKALAPARALLDAAGIAYTQHQIVGHAARCIAEQATKLQCDKVIMGTHGFGTITQLLLGSVSHEAIHLMDPAIPVTLVKNAAEETR
jgi:nucleotide-binding universal stress UspA family protein